MAPQASPIAAAKAVLWARPALPHRRLRRGLGPGPANHALGKPVDAPRWLYQPAANHFG